METGANISSSIFIFKTRYNNAGQQIHLENENKGFTKNKLLFMDQSLSQLQHICQCYSHKLQKIVILQERAPKKFIFAVTFALSLDMLFFLNLVLTVIRYNFCLIDVLNGSIHYNLICRGKISALILNMEILILVKRNILVLYTNTNDCLQYLK